MNIVPKPRPKVKITVKEFEDFDAPKVWYKRIFHKAFHLAMRWKIEEMVAESSMEEDELRAHKRARDLKHVQRRLWYHIVYLVVGPASGVLAVMKAYEEAVAGDRWCWFWLAMGILWFRQFPKDLKSRRELQCRKMELLVEDIHDR